MEADDILDFDFPVTSVVNKVILQSGDFKDIFNELDPTSEFVELFLSPEAPFFQITTNGLAGECQVSFSYTNFHILFLYCDKFIWPGEGEGGV